VQNDTDNPFDSLDSAETSDVVSDNVMPSDGIGGDGALESGIDAISAAPVDFSAFRSLPFDDALSNGILAVSIIGLLVAALYVTGFAMKLACRITGGRRITVRRGIVATILMSAAYALVAGVAAGFSSAPSLLLTLAMQVTLGTLVLGALLWQNPIRAFATGLVASILQTILLVGVFAASILLVGQFVPPKKLQQLADHTQAFTDSLAKEVLPGDEEKARQLLSIKSLVESPGGQASAAVGPKVKMIHERGMRNNPFVE